MKRFKILVVDDDERALKQLVLLLQESFPGSEITAAQSVEEAMVLITKNGACSINWFDGKLFTQLSNILHMHWRENHIWVWEET